MTETDYFPELKEYKSKHKYNGKYGIYNISLVKDLNVIGGQSWRYAYYDEFDNKMKLLSSYDLRRLRQSVEEKGLRWIITDLNLARETYKLNEEMVNENERIKNEHSLNRIAEHTVSKSGVQYVYLNNNEDNVYWTYRDKKHPTITRKTLTELKQAVTDKGYKWIVKDAIVYNNLLEEEKE